MNVERIKQIAQDIREHEDMFDMQRIGNPMCGAPGCIVGFVRGRRYAPYISLCSFYEEVLPWVAKFFDIEFKQVDMLCAPDPATHDTLWSHKRARGENRYITAEHAACCLEHLAETGDVDWDATDPMKQENNHEC